THLPWENLEIDSDRGLGVYATRTALSLSDVTLRPNLTYPFGATEQGQVNVEGVRFAYAEGPPVARLPRLEIEQGLLELTPLSSKEAFVFTSLTPWWWTVRTQFGDYLMRFSLDL